MPETVEDLIDEINNLGQHFARLANNNGWRLRPDTKIFINSEFKCPLCRKGYPTNLVYMVDEEHRRIIGCWTYPDMNPVGNYGKEAVHPHADNNGKLCMGTAINTTQLIFNSIAPGKHHRHTDTWLLMVGHECKLMETRGCVVCGESVYLVEAVYYNTVITCSDQCRHQAYGSICWRCGDYLGQGSIKNRCKSCFPLDSVPCMNCSKRILVEDIKYVGTDFYICEDCFETKSKKCIHCNILTPFKTMAKRCCPSCQYTPCKKCRGEYRQSAMDELGRCRYCRPKFRCPCGTLVSTEGSICEACQVESLRQPESVVDGLRESLPQDPPAESELMIPTVVESDFDIFEEPF